MIVVSGQVKRADLVGTTGVRQRGVQEVDIVSVVEPITKEAVDYWRRFEPWLGPLMKSLGSVLTCYPAVPEDLW